MILQQETLFDIVHEVDELLQMHYEEVALNRDRKKLSPKWEDYRALEVIGNFVIYTAREDKKLIGYAAFFVHTHMHYSEFVTAVNDVIFLHPDHRKGSAGYKLIKFADDQLQKRSDVDHIFWHVKKSNDWTKILHRLGYTDEEIIVGRSIKRN